MNQKANSDGQSWYHFERRLFERVKKERRTEGAPVTIDFAIRTKHNKVRASRRGHIATCLKPTPPQLMPPMAIHSLTARILSSPFPFVGRSNKAVPLHALLFLPAHKVAESKNEIESVIIGKAEMAQASFVAHDNILGHKDRRSSAHRHILVFAIRGRVHGHPSREHSFRHAPSVHQTLCRRLIWFCPDSRAIKTDIIASDPPTCLPFGTSTRESKSCQN